MKLVSLILKFIVKFMQIFTGEREEEKKNTLPSTEQNNASNSVLNKQQHSAYCAATFSPGPAVYVTRSPSSIFLRRISTKKRSSS